jgi:hypothetical protein
LLRPEVDGFPRCLQFSGWPIFDRVQRDFFFRLPDYRPLQGLDVIAVDLGMLSRPADRPVELPPVDELNSAHRVDVDKHFLDGRTLRGMGGGGVAVIDVPQLGEVDAEFGPVVKFVRAPKT